MFVVSCQHFESQVEELQPLMEHLEECTGQTLPQLFTQIQVVSRLYGKRPRKTSSRYGVIYREPLYMALKMVQLGASQCYSYPTYWGLTTPFKTVFWAQLLMTLRSCTVVIKMDPGWGGSNNTNAWQCFVFGGFSS